MLTRFFLNNSNKKMLAPHAVHIAVTISSLIASLCFTFAEPFDIFLFVKLCIGQRKYKQKFTTQGSTDRPTKRVNSRSLTKLLFCILQNSCKNGNRSHLFQQQGYRLQTFVFVHSQGGGCSQKNWVGVCNPFPKTLILFMTKICNFPYPLTKNLIPYL